MTYEDMKKRAEMIFNAVNSFKIDKYTMEDVDRFMPFIVERVRNFEAYDDALREVCYKNGCDIESFSYQEGAVRSIVEKEKNVLICFSGPDAVIPRRR